ncbi:MAG TPA: VWA domain-containing protein [bacterium]|nr:VWA domain-containing protein [bacterium]HPN43495.1 VWA domain-containing protein [bacterium]
MRKGLLLLVSLFVFSGLVSCGKNGAEPEKKPSTIHRDVTSFKITGHGIEIQEPAFVNLMMQITDLEGVGVDFLERDDLVIVENDTMILNLQNVALQVRKKDDFNYSLKTVLAIDVTSSAGNFMPEIKNAALAYINKMSDKQSIAIYTFAENVTMVQDFTSNKTTLIDAINALTAGSATRDLYGAVLAGADKLGADVYSATGFNVEQNLLVVITTGADSKGTTNPAQALTALENKAMYAVCIGGDVNDLKNLAKTGYFLVTDLAKLSTTFTNLQYYADSFYWLNYVTGRRGMVNNSVDVTVKANQYSGEGAHYISQFRSTIFYNASFGLYINQSDKYPKGVDTVFVLPGKTNHVTATSVFVTEIPQYTWTTSNSAIASVTPDLSNPFMGFIKSEGNWDQSTKITIKDVANNISKTITALLNVDEATFTFVDSLDKNLYYISNRKEEWEVAEAICELNGGHLATISSAEENAVCLSCVRKVSDDALIGFHDKLEEGNWTVWSATGEPVTYSNWASSQPDNALYNEQYGSMNTSGSWNDVRGAFYFILEVEY